MPAPQGSSRIIMSQCSCLNSTSGRRREPARLIYLWGSPTSEMGQSRKFCDVRVTSALPLKADIHRKAWHVAKVPRSEEHTSELQSPDHLVCRLLLEKKNRHNILTPEACLEAHPLHRAALSVPRPGNFGPPGDTRIRLAPPHHPSPITVPHPLRPHIH